MLKDFIFNLKVHKRYRLFVLFSIIAACLALSLYFIFILETEAAHTHAFYIPIVLAGVWYHKKAVYVAIFLGAVFILALHFSPLSVTIEALGRAVFL